MTRWQPPHPDPRKGHQPDSPVTKRKPKAEKPAESPWAPFTHCMWEGCRNQRTQMTVRGIWGDYRYHLCDDHIEQTLAAVQCNEDQTSERLDRDLGTRTGDRINGYIYYVYVDETIKIGFTTDLNKRINQYPPTARLLAIEPGTKKLERARHSLFHVHLAHGREWFRPNAELDAWIQQVIDKHGPPPFETGTRARPDDTRPIVAGKRHYMPRR